MLAVILDVVSRLLGRLEFLILDDMLNSLEEIVEFECAEFMLVRVGLEVECQLCHLPEMKLTIECKRTTDTEKGKGRLFSPPLNIILQQIFSRYTHCGKIIVFKSLMQRASIGAQKVTPLVH